MVIEWLGQNWFDVLSTVSITAGFLQSASARREDARQRRIQNRQNALTAHWDQWRLLIGNPELQQILDASLPKDITPTIAQRLFVRERILWLENTFQEAQYDFAMKESGLPLDIKQFFSLPIPAVVWRSVKEFQEPDFVIFVEHSL